MAGGWVGAVCPPRDGSSGVFDPPLRLDLGRLAWFCVDSWCLWHWAPSRHLHPSSCAKAIHLSCVVSWCSQHQVASKGIFMFLQIPDVSLRLASFLVLSALLGHLHPPSHTKIRTVLSALGVLSTKVIPDHLHSSCTKNVPLSCITSGCPQHRVPSQGISILLHMQAVSLHHVSSLGIRGTRCPPGASACSFCQPPPSISHQPLILVFSAPDALPGHLCRPSHAGHSICHHLLVSLAPGALPGHHQATSLHPTPFGVFGTGCPPGTSLCSFMHKPASSTLSHCFWMFFALLEHLHPP